MPTAPTAPLPSAVPALPAVVGDDRRRSERVPQMVEGWMSGASNAGRSGSNSSGRKVFVRDLSLHGVGLISDSASTVGDRCWVLIHRGALRLSTRVQIVACRPRDDGRFDLGGEFY